MMREGLQTNFPHEALRRSGCLFFSLMKWLEIKDGMSFSDEALIGVFNRAAEAGILNPANCFINNSVSLLNLALGRDKYRDVVRDLKRAPVDDTGIKRLVRNNGVETHFIMFIGGRDWDTKDPRRAAAKTWSFHSFREPV